MELEQEVANLKNQVGELQERLDKYFGENGRNPWSLD